MTARLTGSTIERAASCPTSFALQQYGSTSGDDAQFGIEAHQFLRAVLVVGRDEALAETHDPAVRERCAAIRVDKLPAMHPDGYNPEVGIAFDVATGKARILGANMEHAQVVAMLGPTEIGGVIDVLGVTPDRSCALVFDYKTGWRRVAPARTNHQIKFYAFAAARALGCTSAVGALVYVRSDDRDPWFDVARFDRFALDEIGDEITEIAADVARARVLVDLAVGYNGVHLLDKQGNPVTVKLITGEHCKRCPAFTACPAQITLLRSIVASPETALVPTFTDLPEEQREQIVRKLDDAEQVLKRARSMVHAFASANPIKFANGLVYGPVVQEREEIDGEITRAVLEERVGPEDAKRALTWHATKKGIERVLRPHAKPRQLTKDVRSLLEEVARRGGVKKKITAPVKLHRPDEGKETIDAD